METQEIRQHLATLEATPARLETALKGVSRKLSLWSPAPGKWSILEIVCHLRDMEREAYLDRYRRVLEAPADGAGTVPSLESRPNMKKALMRTPIFLACRTIRL